MNFYYRIFNANLLKVKCWKIVLGQIIEEKFISNCSRFVDEGKYGKSNLEALSL